MPTGKLSPLDELKKEWDKRIGQIITSEEHRAKGPGFTNSTLNRDVTRDGIRIFVDGEGDLNPLFRDPEYGKKSKYKILIVPPNYLYTISWAQRPQDHGPMIPGTSGFYSGCEREWFRPVCEGEKITYRVMRGYRYPEYFANGGGDLNRWSYCNSPFPGVWADSLP